MQLNDIAMVAADTSRSRAYLQALIRHEMLPAYVLLLATSSDTALPGQLIVNDEELSSYLLDTKMDFSWSEAQFDPTLPLISLLKQYDIPYEVSANTDINDHAVIKSISERPESVFIFSGFGGVLLRKHILSIGKKFLHVHGGYLPDYKGSTTNYYSLLAENTMGASSLFLSEEIDSGPVLLRRSFPSPPDMTEIDHVYDSAVRAKVLVETLERYRKTGEWQFELANNIGGETYYIIHPVLKHIAIMTGDT
jgi:methionyl-tRNA formyltransferase